MAHIKEPLDVDFFVEPQPLSDAERKMISAHIQNYKKNHGGVLKSERKFRLFLKKVILRQKRKV